MDGLTKIGRIKKSGEFKSVFKTGRRLSTGNINIYYMRRLQGSAKSESHSTPVAWRMGLAVGKKVGNAVIRNRVKRILREAFRLETAEVNTGKLNATRGGVSVVEPVIVPCDVVLVAKPSMKASAFTDVRKEIGYFLQRVAK